MKDINRFSLSKTNYGLKKPQSIEQNSKQKLLYLVTTLQLCNFHLSQSKLFHLVSICFEQFGLNIESSNHVMLMLGKWTIHYVHQLEQSSTI